MQLEPIVVTSSDFINNGYMPKENTGYGADCSPRLILSGVASCAKSLAIIMVDLDIPFVREFPHWVVWNLPVTVEIPAAIPHGAVIAGLGGAKQGLAYGKHQYKGPKPPAFIRSPHRYVFTVYVLDTLLDIGCKSNKRMLLAAMQGHVLQQGSITGLYKNG